MPSGRVVVVKTSLPLAMIAQIASSYPYGPCPGLFHLSDMSCQLGSLESSLLYPPSRSLQYCLWSISSDTGTIIVGLNVLSNGPESFVEI
ncbi:hypothetical protein CPAR01_10433 [Colletotrichum paranaense]|uniref:Uncharacterized protein n=1 Tax=Colletotrichum paranaense TaxID=1914294 RepID=A0ABQ9SE03_9PEZI|nr:uncharacterized protein CPAR01_10433 [Colletotrichum paranaense]KAK1533725.1 hypothetical protein CPAR01_10433 [Colletotrichum paranaense]